MLEIKTKFLREDTVISDMVGIMGSLEFPSLSSPSSYWIISFNVTSLVYRSKRTQNGT